MCSTRERFKSALIATKTLPRLVIKLQIITLACQPKMGSQDFIRIKLQLTPDLPAEGLRCKEAVKSGVPKKYTSTKIYFRFLCVKTALLMKYVSAHRKIIIRELFQRHHLWIQLSQPRHITKEALMASGFHGNSRGFHLNCHITPPLYRRGGTASRPEPLALRVWRASLRSTTIPVPIPW